MFRCVLGLRVAQALRRHGPWRPVSTDDEIDDDRAVVRPYGGLHCRPELLFGAHSGAQRAIGIYQLDEVGNHHGVVAVVEVRERVPTVINQRLPLAHRPERRAVDDRFSIEVLHAHFSSLESANGFKGINNDDVFLCGISELYPTRRDSAGKRRPMRGRAGRSLVTFRI